MPDLNPATRKDLEARCEALLKEVAAIEFLLGVGPPANNGAAARRPRKRVGGVRRREGGFRAEIRKVLADYPKGLKPAKVTAELRARGVKYTAKTPMTTRVSNELHRMAGSSQLKRTNSGIYKLVDGNGG